MTGGDETDVLAVGFFGIDQAEPARELADFRLGHRAERKAQAPELVAGRGEQEIALVPIRVGGAIERLAASAVVARDNVVPGRQKVGAEIARRSEQVGEFHVLVAGDAGDRRFARDIGARERLDHLLAEALLVVENVVGNSEPRGDVAGVVDILAGAARALAMGRLAVVVELHGHADHVIALAGQQRSDDGGIDAARHRHHNAGFRGRLVDSQAIGRAARDLREGCREHSVLIPATPPDGT